MKIHLVVFVFITLFFNVYGSTDFENCASLDGIERKCMEHMKCPKEIQDLLSQRPTTTQELERSKITSCGNDEFKLCCPLPECYTWDGRPGTCMKYNNSRFADMTLKQKKDSRCLKKSRTLCYSELPVQQFGDCTIDLSAFPPDPTSGCCGQQYLGRKYGLSRSFFLHPWFALLKYPRDTRHCSGVLISAKYVLTAAHCVSETTKNEKPHSVVLGKNNKASTEDCLADAPCYDTVRETRPIEEIVVHPEYDSTSLYKRHDIALIRLAGIVMNTEFIKPICLPIDTVDKTRTPSVNFNLYSVGWGAHDDDYLPSESVSRKRQVQLQFVDPKTCVQSYERLWIRQMCARSESDTELCIGDNGGPLMRDRNGTFEIIGIPSYNKSVCGTDANIPTVYTKVYSYAVWIHNTIRP